MDDACEGLPLFFLDLSSFFSFCLGSSRIFMFERYTTARHMITTNLPNTCDFYAVLFFFFSQIVTTSLALHFFVLFLMQLASL